tara:strand:- start:30 stop:458 length:429 start_codon:yes stop_codon:yes gene_type:complete
MPACSFCKKNYDNPRGLTIFTFDGKSVFYCSSKCRSNAKLGRDPKKTNWVKSEKKVKVKKEKVEKKKKDKDLEKSIEGTKGESSGDDKSKSVDVVDNKKERVERKVEDKKDKNEEKKVEVKKDAKKVEAEKVKQELIEEEAE